MSSQNTTQGDNSLDTSNASSYQLYQYVPSLPAAIVFVILFTLVTLYHVWLIKRHHSWYFIAFTIGGFFQILGYSGRLWSHFDSTKLGGYIMQGTLILIAPALYAASIYMILSRLIRVLGAESHSIISIRWMTKIFVFGDVVSFFMQAGGGGIQASGSFDTGKKIIIIGLFVQIFMFSLFLITAVAFHRNILKQSTALIYSYIVDWKRYLHILYLTSILILIRSIFRIVEYLQGHDGFLVSHEIFLYLFDAVLMFLVMVIFAIWYIGDLQKKKVESLEFSLENVPLSNVETRSTP